jgi:hypothetical protein
MKIVDVDILTVLKGAKVMVLRTEDITRWVKKSRDNFTLYKDTISDDYFLVFKDEENLFHVAETFPNQKWAIDYSQFLFDWLRALDRSDNVIPQEVLDLNKKYDINIVQYEGIRY